MNASSSSPLTRAEAGVGFVHLHVHSSYSLREGAIGIGKLAKLAAADKMPALAIADTNNLFGALEFSEKIAKDGHAADRRLQIALDFGDGAAMAPRGEESGAGRASSCSSPATSRLLNLMHIASRAWLDPAPGDTPHVALARLDGHTASLIALTGGPAGPLDRAFAADRPRPARAG